MRKPLKILLLAGNTLRARAYAQNLSNLDRKEYNVQGLFFGFGNRKVNIPLLDNITEKFFLNENLFIPNFNEDLYKTFTKHNWEFKEARSEDVNGEEVLDLIRSFEVDIIVFAGYGGQILRSGHFEINNTYLHMHPGKLPIERGSTTIFYSILNQRKCTVTAFYMTKKIDEGKNVLFEEFTIPAKGVDIDRWYDNVIRTNCFVKAIQKIRNNEFHGIGINEASEEYYVIHPVLKHVGITFIKISDMNV